MADLTGIEASQSVKVVGQDATGAETYPVKASSNLELGVADVLNNGGADTILNLTTTPIQGMVGPSPRAERKYFIMEALTNNVKWGFSSTTQSFDLFKSQIIMIPVGPTTEIWFKVTAGTGQVAIGEVS